MLTEREAFKVAFLQRCADMGMTPAETGALVKSAADRVEKVAFTDFLKWLGGLGVDAVKGIGGAGLSLATNVGLPAALILPPAVGAAAGYGLSKAVDLNDEDPADVKNREKLDAYRRATELARSRTAQSEQRERVSGRRGGRSLI